MCYCISSRASSSTTTAIISSRCSKLFLSIALIIEAKRLHSEALLQSSVAPYATRFRRRSQQHRLNFNMPKHEADDSTSDNATCRKDQTSLYSFFPPSKEPRVEQQNDSSLCKSPTIGTIATKTNSYTLYCDLDGVLVDFDAGVRKLFRGKGPDDIRPSSMMWAAITKVDRFYYHLPWTSDGKMLWNSIRHLSPNILTGVPMFKQSRQDKAGWCKRELGMVTNHVDMAGPKGSHLNVSGRKNRSICTVNVITCWSRNKHMESGVNA
jgi:hypothetical protein